MTPQEKLKIFSAYFPHKVKCTFEGDNNEHLIVGLDITDTGVHILSPFNDYGRSNVNDVKPILLPLSDLTKEIEHNGERFVPYDMFDVTGLQEEEYDFISKLYDEIEGENQGKNLDFIMPLCPYAIAQKLLELHFNIFSLPESEYVKKE